MNDLRRTNYYHMQGIKRGVVKSLDDPDGLNQVQVMLTDTGFELPFAPVIADFSHKDGGNVVIPSVGDEVIVDFLDGDIRTPVIVGGVYNSKIKPPKEVDKSKNNLRNWTFPNKGMVIEINHEEDKLKITMTSKKGHKFEYSDDTETLQIGNKSGDTAIKMDFKNGEIEIKAKKKISFSAGQQDSLVLEGGKGLALSTQAGELKVTAKDVNLTAQAGFNAKANGQAKISGSASAELSSSGQTAVKGSMLMLN